MGDQIDGGAGVDTLNIYTSNADNDEFPTFASVKNIEIVNVYNTEGAADLADASKFEGVEQLWQIGAAAAVTNLAATTTAGFRNVDSNVSVAAVDAAAIALDNLGEGRAVNVTSGAEGTLNSVTVAGTVKDTDNNKTVDATTLNVTVGKDVESLSVNSAVKTTLTVTDGAGTKTVSTVDASASAGAVSYNAAATVANVKTGAGDDVVTLNTLATATSKAASVATGEGKDTINVQVNANGETGAAATVDAGAGDDKIVIDNTGTVALDVKAGAGNDEVVLADGLSSLASTDKVDGGAGTDTIVIAGKELNAQDYIALTEVITNFEAIEFTSTATVDAGRMTGYKTIETAASASAGDVAVAQAALAAAELELAPLLALEETQDALEQNVETAEDALSAFDTANVDVDGALAIAQSKLETARESMSDLALNAALANANVALEEARAITSDADLQTDLQNAENALSAARDITSDAELQTDLQNAENALSAARDITTDAAVAAEVVTAEQDLVDFNALVDAYTAALDAYGLNSGSGAQQLALVNAYVALATAAPNGSNYDITGADTALFAAAINAGVAATAADITVSRTALNQAITGAEAEVVLRNGLIQAVTDAQDAVDARADLVQAVTDAQDAVDVRADLVQAVTDAQNAVDARADLVQAVTDAQDAVDVRADLVQDVTDAQAAVDARADLVEAVADAQEALGDFNLANPTLGADLDEAESLRDTAQADLDDALDAVAAEVSNVVKVAADQALIANGSLNATAAGYVAATEDKAATYAGSLDITAKGDDSFITAQAESVNLKVAGLATGDVDVVLAGDVKSATISLTNGVNNAKAELATEDTIAGVEVWASDEFLSSLASITLTGNGEATVDNLDGSALVTIDASALGGTYVLGADKGQATEGLEFWSNSSKAETIKLGSGVDYVGLWNSTVKNMDTVTGLNLVDDAAITGKQVDLVKSDILEVAYSGFEKVTVTASSLNLALVDLAKSDTKDAVVFAFGGDTYVYADKGATANVVDDNDLLVKVTGTVDLDLLVSSLNIV